MKYIVIALVLFSFSASAEEVQWSEQVITDESVEMIRRQRPTLKFSPDLKPKVNQRITRKNTNDPDRDLALQIANASGITVTPGMSTIEILRLSLRASEVEGDAIRRETAHLKGQLLAEQEKIRASLLMQELAAEQRHNSRQRQQTVIENSRTPGGEICGDITMCSSSKNCGDVYVCIDSSKNCDTVETCSYDGASCIDVYVCQDELL